MKLRVLVVIPAHNEAESIEGVLEDVKAQLKDADILVVNDCSTDDTAVKAKKYQGVKVLSNPFNIGYAMSIQTGIKYAKRHDYDFVIQMDADGQHLASEAHKLLEACIEKNADIVIGSRFKKKTGYKSPFFRRFGTRLFEGMVKVFTGKKITDPLTGFQCLNKRTINYYAEPGNYPEYPDAGLIIEMLMKKYKIIEVPVSMKQREAGVSMHAGIIQPIKYMTTQLYTCVIIFIKYIGRTK
jgi:glycosyltransferase involved in cell wall biosynthesis